jgi:hypothetical protein
MVIEIPDLWGQIDVAAVSPIAVLRHQAGQLRHRTKGLLEAEVTTSVPKDGRVSHRFVIIAPALDRSRTVLFEASHQQNFVYPVEIAFSPWIKENQEKFFASRREEYGLSSTSAVAYRPEELPDGIRAASSQDQFIALLRKLFSSDYTNALVSSLLARINDATTDSGTAESEASSPPPS